MKQRGKDRGLGWHRVNGGSGGEDGEGAVGFAGGWGDLDVMAEGGEEMYEAADTESPAQRGHDESCPYTIRCKATDPDLTPSGMRRRSRVASWPAWAWARARR